MNLTSGQKEELRHVVLEFLAVRAPAALPLRVIHRGVNKELDFVAEAADVDATLNFLAGYQPSLALATADQLGSSQYWSATTQGVLHHERNS